MIAPILISPSASAGVTLAHDRRTPATAPAICFTDAILFLHSPMSPDQRAAGAKSRLDPATMPTLSFYKLVTGYSCARRRAAQRRLLQEIVEQARENRARS